MLVKPVALLGQRAALGKHRTRLGIDLLDNPSNPQQTVPSALVAIKPVGQPVARSSRRQQRQACTLRFNGADDGGNRTHAPHLVPERSDRLIQLRSECYFLLL